MICLNKKLNNINKNDKNIYMFEAEFIKTLLTSANY